MHILNSKVIFLHFQYLYGLFKYYMISEELVKKSPGYIENIFYFAGSAFLAAGLLAVVVIQMAMCIQVQ